MKYKCIKDRIHSELNSKVDKVRVELNQNNNDMILKFEEQTVKLNNFKYEVNVTIDSSEQKLNSRINSVEIKTNEKFVQLNKQIQKKLKQGVKIRVENTMKLYEEHV